MAVPGSNSSDPPPTFPRYQDALTVCNFVEKSIYSPDLPIDINEAHLPVAGVSPLISRPRILPKAVPPSQVHRLQNLFYAKGNLYLAMGNAAAAQDEYEKAIECVLSLPTWAKDGTSYSRAYPLVGYSTRDLVVAATVLSHFFSDAGSGVPATETGARLELTKASWEGNFGGLMRFVRDGGDSYVARLIKLGGGVLPPVLLFPSRLRHFTATLFVETDHTLPAHLEHSPSRTPEHLQMRQQAIQSTNQTTSTMLLMIAKVIQDSLGTPGAACQFPGIPASPSLLLPLYYLALSLYPSPSTFNNLGILLSTMSATTLVIPEGLLLPEIKTGQQLALEYYKAGLEQDQKHPHLYTNLGSLLKDMGQLPQAVLMYKKAVEFNPNFVSSNSCQQKILGTDMSSFLGCCSGQSRQRHQRHWPNPGSYPILPSSSRYQSSFPRSYMWISECSRGYLRLARSRRSW